MNGWFCRSAFGPGPSVATGVTRVKGLPGQVITAKKNVEIAASVAPAHGKRAERRRRLRQITRLAQLVSSRVQNRIDPSRAAHSEMTLKKGGVVVALLRATYSTLKSWVSSSTIITAAARAAKPQLTYTARRALASSAESRRRVPITKAIVAYTLSANPATIAAWPRSGSI